MKSKISSNNICSRPKGGSAIRNEPGHHPGSSPPSKPAGAKVHFAREHNNFFGITAYGHPNPFWKGDRTDLSAVTGRPTLWFRRYASPEDSFLDFARLIHSAYPVAATLTFHPTAYAKERLPTANTSVK